jgi:diacylglycerol kinase family enzyme
VSRTLLVGNRIAGTGVDPNLLDRLAEILEAELRTVDSHPEARQATKDWLATHGKNAVVIAGGGGGTLRAVVEGACDGRPTPPTRDTVRLGGLRMGSGNVVPKRYGVPRDPIEGARHLKERIDAGSTRPCGVIRCQFGGGPRHGITMVGLGHFGRTSGDLLRLRHKAGPLRNAAAKLVPLERINDAEYLSSFLTRMAIAALVPASCELVSVEGRSFRLLAGVVMNFPISGIPVKPGTDIDDAALGYRLFPRYGAPLAGILQPQQQLTLRLEDRRSTEFFLDEDPETAHGQITIEAAGTLEFVA